jgi:hypothetical protein
MTDPDGPDAAPTGPEGSAAPNPDLTERVVDSKVVHKGHYIEFRVDTIERADGTRGQRDIVGHPGAVAMLAIDEADRVLMVRQFRLAAGGVLLEIPAGTLDVDPATGAVEDPEIASRRELEEETGYRARTWRKLGSFWTAPGFACSPSGPRPTCTGAHGTRDWSGPSASSTTTPRPRFFSRSATASGRRPTELSAGRR